MSNIASANEPRPKNRPIPRWERITVAVIIIVHATLVSWGAWRHSPTVNEPAYLAAGVSHWTFGRFDLCQVSPPLVRLVAGAAVKFAGAEEDWQSYRVTPGQRFEFPVGQDFVIANGPRTFWLFTIGRLACLPFTLLGAWVSYRWTKSLFGTLSGLAALCLWCFSPNILAHAQFLTPDIGVTALSLTACYSVSHWSQSPSFSRAALSGLILGLAVLAKTNAVVLIPALACGIGINAIVASRLRCWQTPFHVVVILLAACYVLNLGYGFERSFQRLGDYKFFSSIFAGLPGENRSSATILSNFRVPLPASFLEGIDLQRRDFENAEGREKTYFRGNWYDRGWWWYYVYVVLVKVPVGTLVLVIIGSLILATDTLASLRCRAFWTSSPAASLAIHTICFIVVPGIAFFVLACSQTGFGHSLRYTLPAFPFGYIVGAVALTSATTFRLAAKGALASVVASSLSVYPHSLSYFNEASGGPLNGDFHLLDGNVEWGQDLLFVQRWVAAHPEHEPIYLAFWSLLPRGKLGITIAEPDTPNSETSDATYIVSVNYLRGSYRRKRPELTKFQRLVPIAYIGYSMRVYGDFQEVSSKDVFLSE